MPLIEVRDFSLAYPTYLGEIQALKNVSFTLRQKEIVALVGESGCGKTTAGLSLLGLTPSTAIRQGNIFFEGIDLMQKEKKRWRELRGKEVAMVFQDPMTSLNPTMSVGKQIRESLIAHRMLTKKEAEKEAVELLNTVGIDEPEKRMRQYPHELSGGMRQRVMIAVAVALKPKLLIADEPTTSLDVTIQAQVLDLLKRLHEKNDMAVLLITHDLGVVAHLAHRVIVMYGGTIVEEGRCEEIFHSPHHPYTQALLRCLPTLQSQKEKKLECIAGSPPSLLRSLPGCPFYSRCPHAMRICPLEFPSFRTPSEHHRIACWNYDKPD